MRCITRRSVIAAGLGLAGCAALDRSRLDHLYGGFSRPTGQPPVILIPGAFGSGLRDRRQGSELWPGSNSKLLLGNYRDLRLPLDPVTLEPDASQAEAYAVLREGLGRDFYGSVIETLERAGGYRCTHDRPRGHGMRRAVSTFFSTTSGWTPCARRAGSRPSSSAFATSTPIAGCRSTSWRTRTAVWWRGTSCVTVRMDCRRTGPCSLPMPGRKPCAACCSSARRVWARCSPCSRCCGARRSACDGFRLRSSRPARVSRRCCRIRACRG